MHAIARLLRTFCGAALALAASAVCAQGYPGQKEGTFIACDFRFHTGEAMADDERNPPELGVMERELKRVKQARLFLIPASDQTAGHGTTGQAKWWAQELAAFLGRVPRRAP